MSTNIRVIRATTPEEKQAVFKLRHQVFIEECRYKIPDADVEQSVRCASDEHAWLGLAYDGATPIGTLALNCWQAGPIDNQLVSQFHLNHFADHFSRKAISVFRKGMVLSKYRGSPVFQQMITMAAMATQTSASQFLFLDCSPALVHYYERLGMRRYAPHFYHDDTGILSVPLVMVLSDHEHLARNGMLALQFARAARITDSPTVRAYFAQHWTIETPTDRLEPDSPLLTPPGDEIKAFDIFRCALFADLTDDAIRTLIASSSESRPFHRKEILRTLATKDDSVYLIVDGYVEVSIDKRGVKLPIATAGPGELVGELSVLLDIPATAHVTALTNGGLLQFPRALMIALLDREPRLAAILYRNLARHLAERLRVRSLWITDRPPL